MIEFASVSLKDLFAHSSSASVCEYKVDGVIKHQLDVHKRSSLLIVLPR